MILQEQEKLVAKESIEELCLKINNILDKKWILVEALFNEMNYANSQLFTIP